MTRLVPDVQDQAWGLFVTAAGQGQSPSGAPQTGWRLYYLVRGAATLVNGSRQAQMLEAGDILLLDSASGIAITPDAERGCIAYQIDFAGEQLVRWSQGGFFAPLPRIIHSGFNEHLLGLIAHITELARLRPPGFARLISGVLADVIARMDAMHTNGATKDRHSRLIEEARVLLVDASHDHFPVQTLAAKMGVGYSQFRRSFRGHTGISPHQFRMNRRLARAQQMLSDTALPIARIATELGFSSQAYFARIFRRQTGLSPSVWRCSQPSKAPIKRPADG